MLLFLFSYREWVEMNSLLMHFQPCLPRSLMERISQLVHYNQHPYLCMAHCLHPCLCMGDGHIYLEICCTCGFLATILKTGWDMADTWCFIFYVVLSHH